MKERIEPRNPIWERESPYRFWREATAAQFVGEWPLPLAVQKQEGYSKTAAARLAPRSGTARLVELKPHDVVQVVDDRVDFVVFRRDGEDRLLVLDKNRFLLDSQPVLLHYDWDVYKQYFIVTPTVCRFELVSFQSSNTDSCDEPFYHDDSLYISPGIVTLVFEDQPCFSPKSHCCVQLVQMRIKWTGDALIDPEDGELLWESLETACQACVH
jgi:hypothetical protein